MFSATWESTPVRQRLLHAAIMEEAVVIADVGATVCTLPVLACIWVELGCGLVGATHCAFPDITLSLALQQAAFFWDQQHDTATACVQVVNASLALAVHEECCAWTRSLAAAMRELDVAALTGIREDIAAKHAVLQKQPEDLEQLKAVLHVINAIRWAAVMPSVGTLQPVQCAIGAYGPNKTTPALHRLLQHEAGVCCLAFTADID